MTTAPAAIANHVPAAAAPQPHPAAESDAAAPCPICSLPLPPTLTALFQLCCWAPVLRRRRASPPRSSSVTAAPLRGPARVRKQLHACCRSWVWHPVRDDTTHRMPHQCPRLNIGELHAPGVKDKICLMPRSEPGAPGFLCDTASRAAPCDNALRRLAWHAIAGPLLPRPDRPHLLGTPAAGAQLCGRRRQGGYSHRPRQLRLLQ
jgi:hypothetical protein